MRTQLVAARTVAEALAELATDTSSAPAPGSSGAPIPEIAGPRAESLAEEVERPPVLAQLRGEALVQGTSASEPQQADARRRNRDHDPPKREETHRSEKMTSTGG
jgi:hypothetical protein